MDHAQTLRKRLAAPEIIKAPGVYDGLSMLLVERAGFDVAFLSGASLSYARFGRPDMGLVTAHEVAETVAILRERSQMPLVVDIDTGFGNAVNVGRTVKTFERAGASALQMEDQVSPKRCGHMAGKDVISKEEMVGKIHAALDARENEDTCIVARTDALGVHGFEDAMDRAHAYKEAGADLLFIEAPKTTEHMQIIGETFGADIPLVHNLVEGSGTPIEQPSELEALGFKLALYPAALLNKFIPMAENLLKTLKLEETTLSMRGDMVDLTYINDLLGAPELMADAKKYGGDE